MELRSTVTITIINWTKYNPRSDVKNPSWFRVEYRMLEDPDFYDFTHEEFRAWLYVLAQACRKNSDTISLNYAHAGATSRLSREGVDNALRKLELLNLVTVSVTPTSRPRDAHDTPTLRDGTGRDGTNGTDSTRAGAEARSSGMTECMAAYGETLRFFGIAKDPRMDDHQIARLISLHKSAEKVRLAIVGARHEAKTDTFKPKDHFSLMRLMKPEQFEKCVNLGAQHGASATAESTEMAEFKREMQEFKEKNGIK